MNRSHQLSVGHKLGGHYEIVEVLGEDEFEILYLVKDLHMGEKNFVLKELFLSAYAFRNDEQSVQVMAKSKQIFEQTKEDVKAEVETLKLAEAITAPTIYGYFEENNTVYTIIEFVKSVDDETYLAVKNEERQSTLTPTTPESVPEPTVVVARRKEEEAEEFVAIESESKKEKGSNSYWFLKLLILGALVMAGLMYYSYDMIQKDKERAKNKPTHVTVSNEPLPHPTLSEKKVEPKEENTTRAKIVVDEVKKEPLEGAAYIEDGELPPAQEEDFAEVPKAEIYMDSEVETVVDEVQEHELPPVVYEQEIPSAQPNVMGTPIGEEKKPSFSLGTKIN